MNSNNTASRGKMITPSGSIAFLLLLAVLCLSCPLRATHARPLARPQRNVLTGEVATGLTGTGTSFNPLYEGQSVVDSYYGYQQYADDLSPTAYPARGGYGSSYGATKGGRGGYSSYGGGGEYGAYGAGMLGGYAGKQRPYGGAGGVGGWQGFGAGKDSAALATYNGAAGYGGVNGAIGYGGVNGYAGRQSGSQYGLKY